MQHRKYRRTKATTVSDQLLPVSRLGPRICDINMTFIGQVKKHCS